MQPFEIHLAKRTWQNCDDERPWLIVTVIDHDAFGCFPVSGEDYSGTAFEVRSDHPDFGATGLKKSCFIHVGRTEILRHAAFLKYRGVLQNQLLDDFKAFSGL